MTESITNVFLLIFDGNIDRDLVMDVVVLTKIVEKSRANVLANRSIQSRQN